MVEREGRTVEVRILEVVRLRSSRQGNPRFSLKTTRGVFQTAVNSQCAYEVTAGWELSKRVLHLDGRGCIWKFGDPA